MRPSRRRINSTLAAFDLIGGRMVGLETAWGCQKPRAGARPGCGSAQSRWDLFWEATTRAQKIKENDPWAYTRHSRWQMQAATDSVAVASLPPVPAKPV